MLTEPPCFVPILTYLRHYRFAALHVMQPVMYRRSQSSLLNERTCLIFHSRHASSHISITSRCKFSLDFLGLEEYYLGPSNFY
jgi:hypothetical protein